MSAPNLIHIPGTDADGRLTRAYDAKIDDVLPGERSVVARINTGIVDYYRTVIDPLGGDTHNFNRNGPVLWNHGKDAMRGTVPIGKGWVKVRSSERDIIGKTKFAADDFSQMIFDMYEQEILKGFSVNVLPSEASPPSAEEIRGRPDLANCEMIYRRWNLIEYSAVALPGNPEALSLVVARGLTMPDDVRPLYEARVRAVVAMPGLPGEMADRTIVVPGVGPVMTDSGGMASGGAAVKPNVKGDDEDDDDDDDKESLTKSGVSPPQPVAKSAEDAPSVARRIVKKNGKFFVYSEDGSKKLGGPYSTRQEATKRLQQVEYFKHEGESRAAPPESIADPDDPVQHDGHGGWTVRGLDGLTFESRGVAERAMSVMANPPRFAAEWDAVNRELQRRSEQQIQRTVEEFELHWFGRV